MKDLTYWLKYTPEYTDMSTGILYYYFRFSLYTHVHHQAATSSGIVHILEAIRGGTGSPALQFSVRLSNASPMYYTFTVRVHVVH